MRLCGPINSGVTAGGAGSSTNNADSKISLVGEIAGIYIKYNDSPPAGTTTVTIASRGSNAPAGNILVLTHVATDGWFRPSQQFCNAAGGAVANAYGGTLVYDFVNIKVEGANDGDSIDVWFLLKGEDE
jgi:hypothetical protein